MVCDQSKEGTCGDPGHCGDRQVEKARCGSGHPAAPSSEQRQDTTQCLFPSLLCPPKRVASAQRGFCSSGSWLQRTFLLGSRTSQPPADTSPCSLGVTPRGLLGVAGVWALSHGNHLGMHRASPGGGRKWGLSPSHSHETHSTSQESSAQM